MGRLKVLVGSGEETYLWNPEAEEEVEDARKKFEAYRGQGFLACRISAGGKEGTPLTEFDPKADEIFVLGFVDGG